MELKAKVSSARRPKDKPVFFELEEDILKFGLNSEPASANVVAKRLHMKENPKNISMIRQALNKMLKEQKVYRCGSRYAIDYRGGINLMQSFCIKIADDAYKINNFAFEHMA